MQFSCFSDSDERILWLCSELINSEGHIKSKSLRETHAGQEAGLAQPPTGTASTSLHYIPLHNFSCRSN